MAVFRVTSAADAVADGDGTTLREGLLAVHQSPGEHRIEFAPELAGQVIAIAGALPAIRADGLVVQGLVAADGTPLITLDFSQAPATPGMTLLPVHASHVTLAGLAFQGVQSTQVAVFIEATQDVPLVQDVSISGCVFEGVEGAAGYAVRVGTNDSPQSVGLTVRDVEVSGSRFTGFRGDATTVHAQAAGDACTIDGLVVSGNSFTDCTYPVELVVYQGQGNVISAALIDGNTFTNNHQPVSLFGGGNSVDGLISGTLIQRNMFIASENAAVSVNAGTASAEGTFITATTIRNNLFLEGMAGIWVGGGAGTGNGVDGLLATNNTLSGGNIALIPSEGGTGNGVQGLVIRNSIIQSGGDDFFGPITAAHVYNCILTDSDFNADGLAMHGVNGNLMADPRFVDAAGGDLQLQGASPAIDAGVATDAPSADFAGWTRVDVIDRGGDSAVDAGAFEFTGGAGDDRLDFGAGWQSLALAGARSLYEVEVQDGRLFVSGPQGEDEFRSLERLLFDDAGIALDFAPGESANETVRVITAAFGVNAVAAHPDWAGIGIALFDAGFSVPQVCALVAPLLGLDNEAFVATVASHLFDTAPAAEELEAYVALLQGSGGTMSQGELLGIAALSPLAHAAAGMEGWALSGMPFH